MLVEVLRLVSRRRYHLVHAVEESAFIALVLKWVFKIPYVYDMDSSLAQQMVEKYPLLSPFSCLMSFFEGLVVRNAQAVVPVCEALAHAIQRHGPRKIEVLHDVPILKTGHQEHGDLKAELGLCGPLLMYVGNLEAYQGMDLLLESFALALRRTDRGDLVVIGGEASDVQKYREKATHLGIQHKVHFLGPRPVDHLEGYLAQADILVSPRMKGKNTPMKIYSYLHSGKAILATDLPTHTQVLDSRVALLARPSPEAFSQGMLRLIEDEGLRRGLGQAGKSLVEESFTYNAFCKKLNGLYDWLQGEVGQDYAVPSMSACSRKGP